MQLQCLLAKQPEQLHICIVALFLSYTHLQVPQQLIDTGGRLVQHDMNVPHARRCSKRAPGTCSKHHVCVTTVQALQVLQLAGRADSSQRAAHRDLYEGKQTNQ